jgi:hypothetical protein
MLDRRWRDVNMPLGSSGRILNVDSVGLQNIYPGAFFLALNEGSYNATVGYVRLTYRW